MSKKNLGLYFPATMVFYSSIFTYQNLLFVELELVLLLLVLLLFPVWLLLLLLVVFLLSSIVVEGGSPISTCIRVYYEKKSENTLSD